MTPHRTQHLDRLWTSCTLWGVLLGARPSWPLSERARRPRSQGNTPASMAVQTLRLAQAVVLLVLCIGVTACVSRDEGGKGRVAQSATQGQDGRGFAVVPAVAAAAAGRTALVIGNEGYSEDIGALKNPGNDATDIAVTLRQLGFAVTLVHDAPKQQMVEAVETFSRQLRADGVGLFYFAGHGAVGTDGHNYLLPLGIRVTRPLDMQFGGVDVDWVLARMGEAGERATTILILDACRNAPFRSLWRASPSGFGAMSAPGGSLIAYATAPGKTAGENRGQRNGCYTKHLLRLLQQPNLPVEQLFKQVRLAVEDETRASGVLQTSWESSSLRGEFSFNPDAGGTVGTPAVSPPTVSPPTVVTPPPPPRPSASGGTQAVGGVSPPTSPTPLPTITGNDGAPMVLVSAGEFTMGSNEYEEEKPPHRVYLETFYLDTYEVTNARFQQFVQISNYRTRAERDGSGWADTGEKWETVNGASWRAPQGPGSSITGLEQHPVVQVSQEDAKAYCAWAGKRLPTEAEWEKAARGTDGRRYPWGEQFDGARLNFCDVHCRRSWQDKAVNDGYRYTAPVGRYEGGKSPYGAYDMAGNVWE